MDSKKIDNEIKTHKAKINELDNHLNIEKKKLKRIDEMQESLYELNKNMSQCIELLSKSIVGGNSAKMFSEMENKNRTFYIKSNSILEEESARTMEKINGIYKEKINEIEKSKKEEKE